MSAVWQKIVADLLHRRAISLLIITTIITAAALLTLALSTLMNLGGPYDKLFAELNSAHRMAAFHAGARQFSRYQADRVFAGGGSQYRPAI